MSDVSPQAAGTWYTVIVGGLISAAAGLAKHYVDAHFKRKRDEDERMKEREDEVAENAAMAPLRAEIIRLGAELAKERERAAELAYSAEVSASEAKGLGEDVVRLAAEKALAEQQRDEELRKRVEAEGEAEEWKRLALEAERRNEASAAKNTAVKISPKETQRAQTAPKRPANPGLPVDADRSGGRSPGGAGDTVHSRATTPPRGPGRR